MLPSTVETLAATAFISLLSLVGVFTLSISEVKLHKILSLLVAFSAGTILGAALFDLLPEAVEIVEGALVFPLVAFGFVVFMFLERIIYWYHGHGHSHEFEEPGKKKPLKEFAYLNILGDLIHNFIDGMIIAAGFTNSFNVGLATTVAVAFHELPQEIGDFGILVYAGMERRRALLYNFLAALSAVLGGFLGSSFFYSVEGLGGYMIAFSAGAFIFLSASELIPELHDGENRLQSMVQLAVLVLGMLTIYAMGLLFSG